MANVLNERNQKIIKKIKGLLSLSENNSNEDEAQSAFLMAQKLMLKNNISLNEVKLEENKENIDSGQVTIHKQLYWWERHLANVMGENFRVKSYINRKKLKGETKRKKAICFLGYESDVKLAKEMYMLAYEAITTLSKIYVEEYYIAHKTNRLKRITIALKNSYMLGFLEGLEQKFQEQFEQMKKEENALMVLVPEEVKEEYKKQVTGKGTPFRIPSVQESNAYTKGYKDGNKIDYTRSTIKDISV
ncbi:DUF2786 domain-containing protein [Bacillus tianshenii]|nr:DUF2786 domain-containing protein [Bacillus tianshenii]